MARFGFVDSKFGIAKKPITKKYLVINRCIVTKLYQNELHTERKWSENSHRGEKYDYSKMKFCQFHLIVDHFDYEFDYKILKELRTMT